MDHNGSQRNRHRYRAGRVVPCRTTSCTGSRADSDNRSFGEEPWCHSDSSHVSRSHRRRTVRRTRRCSAPSAYRRRGPRWAHRRWARLPGSSRRRCPRAPACPCQPSRRHSLKAMHPPRRACETSAPQQRVACAQAITSRARFNTRTRVVRESSVTARGVEVLGSRTREKLPSASMFLDHTSRPDAATEASAIRLRLGNPNEMRDQVLAAWARLSALTVA